MSELAGLGVLVLCCMMAWIFYQIFASFKYTNKTEAIYETAQQVVLKKCLQKKGVDIDKEIMKQNIINKLKKKRSIRRRLEYEAYKDFFGDDKDVPEMSE